MHVIGDRVKNEENKGFGEITSKKRKRAEESKSDPGKKLMN